MIRLRLFLTVGVAFFVIALVAGVGGLGIFGAIENALSVKREFQAYRAENERLRHAVSDLTLDKLILKEAASGNF